MSKNAKNIFVGTIAAVLILTLTSSIFGYIALTKDFDHDIFHFKNGSVLAALSICLPIVSAVISLVPAITLRKKLTVKGIPEANVPMIFASVLAGLLMIVSAGFGFAAEGEMSKIALGTEISAIIGGIYMILLPFTPKKPFMTILSFAPAVWAAFTLLEEYFRDGEPINSPVRTVNLTMFAFLLLLFAEEIRFFIGNQTVGGYYFCILSSIAFTGAAVLPKLIIILTDNAQFDFSVIDWALYAALFLFLLARLSVLPSVLGDPDEKDADTPAEEIASDNSNTPNTDAPAE